MGVANDHTVRRTDADDLGDCTQHLWMFVLSRVPQFLAEVTFTDQDDADARNVLQNVGEVLNAGDVLALEDDQDLTFGVEGPYVRALVVLRW
jgi:hypothetical protein